MGSPADTETEMMKLVAFTLLLTGALSVPLKAPEPYDCDDSKDNCNIPDKALQLGLTTLVDLVVRAGLADVLNGPGPFTVVGPVNEAFTPERISQEILDFILGNNTALAEVLKYHVTAGEIRRDDVTNNMLVPTLQGKTCRLNKYMVGDLEIITSNGIPITNGDNEADNGIIQVMEFMQYPPVGDVVDVALSIPTLSTLVTALGIAELVETLKGAGPFTIFAPTNEAFAKIDNLDEILEDKELLTSILLHHVVPDARYSISLGQANALETINGAALKVLYNEEGELTINGAKVIPGTNDFSGTNGIIHQVDTVLLPPTANIPEKALELGLTTLVDLVTRAGLAPVLSGPGPFSVLGPVNEAFTADRFPQELLDFILGNNTALAEVLKYHVTDRIIRGVDVENNQLVPTLNGKTVRLNKYRVGDNEFTTANGSPIIFPGDEEATNGVIQMLDYMVFPPVGDAVDLAVSTPELGTLVTALGIAELVETLRGDGPFTILAPTNEAFAKIDNLAEILEDEELLTSILLYHVIGDARYSVSMVDGSTIQTLEGNAVTISNPNFRDITINGVSKVERKDWTVTNGVIQTIDTVLLPPSINHWCYYSQCRVLLTL